MTIIIAETTSKYVPPSWRDVLGAAFLTWLSALVLGGAITLIQQGLSNTGIGIKDLGVFRPIFLFGFVLLFSGYVSWVPLALMVPALKWLFGFQKQLIVLGAAIGLGIGSFCALFLFGNRMLVWGMMTGATLGTLNFWILHGLIRRT